MTSLQSPLRVAALPTHHRERVLVRFRSGSGRAHQYLIGFNRPNALNPVRTPSGAISSRAGNWGRAVERTISLVAPARPLFLSLGEGHRRLICNLSRALSAGSSFLHSLVQNPQKSDGRFFVSFQFPPALRSSVAHVQNMQRKDARSHEQCTREYE